ncbi:tyrosine-type recombinase/integrase [Pseudomonas aeruginosa]|nr:tyrosine-type recombinase/integrase [Pseudomonas aeruginosa]
MSLRNDGNLRGVDNNQAWGSAKSFVTDIVSHLSFSSAGDCFNAPSLKTENSRRQLPLTAEIVSVSDIVLGNYRKKASHSYLFGSQQNKPLSLRSIHRVFEVASENLSSAAKKELAMRNRSSVTAHDLRHTCAVYRLGRYVSLGDEIDMAAERLRVFLDGRPPLQCQDIMLEHILSPIPLTCGTKLCHQHMQVLRLVSMRGGLLQGGYFHKLA